MNTTNISVLRKNLFSAVDNVIEFNDSIKVNTRRGNAVIISEEEYNSLMETVYLSSIPDFINKVKEGEKEDIEKMPIYNPNEEW